MPGLYNQYLVTQAQPKHINPSSRLLPAKLYLLDLLGSRMGVLPVAAISFFRSGSRILL